MPPLPLAVSPSATSPDLIAQISTNLSNTLSTFGRGSVQYAAVLDMLRGAIQELEMEGGGEETQDVTAINGGGGEETAIVNVIEDLRKLLERGLKV
ncbi:hypothetical protein HCBG_05827 [Histoplasma capsulatum G186AR]|uniref:Uncharacterized protein n=1 Tax=Ajellomyces capsulatus (strain G186AR / H82 / ATCC MYA-2454 / RMSCC 2432) TaxID=447093 RepID=C0NRP7_AJECG|nr:uncharacterized protein HCBG_05827 [Histoplasma capsulatum G186AR]EEH05563.1 hypothetical protein HCBG_05827 [Histoplasma capsulatum G186AR]